MTTFELFFDGACQPKNPGGHMGYGYVCEQEGCEIFSNSYSEKAGINNTNNVAEYKACYFGLLELKDYLEINNIKEYTITVFGDSMLVIKQMSGKWRIKQGAYSHFARNTASITEHFKNIKFQWIPREENSVADELSCRELVNQGIIRSR